MTPFGLLSHKYVNSCCSETSVHELNTQQTVQVQHKVLQYMTFVPDEGTYTEHGKVQLFLRLLFRR